MAGMSGRSRQAVLGAIVFVMISALSAVAASANVLLVGTYSGIAGK